MYQIDRMEEGRLVVLDEEGRSLLLQPHQLASPAAEGDVILPGPDGLWRVDAEATATLRQKNHALLQKILGRK